MWCERECVYRERESGVVRESERVCLCAVVWLCDVCEREVCVCVMVCVLCVVCVCV